MHEGLYSESYPPTLIHYPNGENLTMLCITLLKQEMKDFFCVKLNRNVLGFKNTCLGI